MRKIYESSNEKINYILHRKRELKLALLRDLAVNLPYINFVFCWCCFIYIFAIVLVSSIPDVLNTKRSKKVKVVR